MALTLKMRTFCLAFVGEANGNATEAARISGYKGNDVTLGAVAYENLKKPQVAAFIERLRQKAESHLEGKILSATEVLVKLTDIICSSDTRDADKIKACELLGKYHKLFTDKVEHNHFFEGLIAKLSGDLSDIPKEELRSYLTENIQQLGGVQ